jgi:poly(hydroxyalkanoate) depolymerase family esterase
MMAVAHAKVHSMWQRYPYSDTQGNHSYFVYMPKTSPVKSPLPLIIMLHGCTQTAEDFAASTAMNLLAEQYGFVVLYPQQTLTCNYKRCWNWFLPANQHRGSGEPARIVGMMKSLRQKSAPLTIDPTRIYVAGFSAGGCMATILGATYPDFFAAIGVHSGLAYQAATNVKGAFDTMAHGGPDPLLRGHAAYMAMGDFSRVVPTIVFQGTKDTTVIPANGDQVMQQWMQTNHLAANEAYTVDFNDPTHVTSGQIADGHAYVVATWNGNNGDTQQVYWKIGNLGHAWSGGNFASSHTDPRGPSASAEMYAFFMAHSMKREERQKIISQRMRRYHLPNGDHPFLQKIRKTTSQIS